MLIRVVTAMGKLRTGPSTSLIRASNGAPGNINDFYATSYQTTYGDDEFTPANVRRNGTGYKANFRPEIFYTNRLDQLDNVQLGHDLTKNYLSSYVKQHSSYNTGSDGNDMLPLRILHRKSGFTEKDPISTADYKNVERARKETKTANIYKPPLYKLHAKKVDHLDDGSMGLATETSTCYLGKPSVRMNTFLKDVGFMEPSGFTHYHHFDPILYLDRSPFDGGRDGRKTSRPTGISENQDRFVKWSTMSGKEANAGVRKRSKRDTGYSKETAKPRFVHRKAEDAFTRVDQMPHATASRVKRQDPCEYLNLTQCGVQKSVTKCNFTGIQKSPQDAEHLLSRVSAGNKELTGFSTNNGNHKETADNAKRFFTHYGVKFAQRNPLPAHASVYGTKQTNGFTKSTAVHSFGDGLSFRPSSLHHLHPYVARKIKLENPCYVDSTRSLKLTELIET